MSVSRSGSTLSPYYVYNAVSPSSLGFGSRSVDNAHSAITMAASSSIMIASSKGTTTYDIWYTANGTSWTRSASSASVFGSNRIHSMCFGNNIFVAVGDNNTIGTSPSTDGGTWTARTKAAGARAGAVARRVHFLNNKFFIWDEDGYIQKSTDGITWTGVADIGEGPNDGASGVGGSSTIIENTSNSALYAFPDLAQQTLSPATRYYFTTDDFTSRTTFQHSATNGHGARFVYARNVNGYQMFIATNGRTNGLSSAQEDTSANQISVALTTVGAATFSGDSGESTAGPAIWPTTHGIPSLTSPTVTSNAGAVGLPTIFPRFGGAASQQAGFWVNYENGYWNLIGNTSYQYNSGASVESLGCTVLRWKADDGVLEKLYSVQSAARFAGSSTVVKGGDYNFQHRTTQTNGGNEVVFKDVVYIPVRRTTNADLSDIIVGRRKILTRNQL